MFKDDILHYIKNIVDMKDNNYYIPIIHVEKKDYDWLFVHKVSLSDQNKILKKYVDYVCGLENFNKISIFKIKKDKIVFFDIKLISIFIFDDLNKINSVLIQLCDEFFELQLIYLNIEITTFYNLY